MEIRIQCLCLDTADPARIASFWEAALGWRRTWEEEDQVCLEPPEGSAEDGVVPDLLFLRVPMLPRGMPPSVPAGLGQSRLRGTLHIMHLRHLLHSTEERRRHGDSQGS
jgi:hypothetical protein